MTDLVKRPSGSNIFLNCPASPRLSLGIADTSSVYAEEGTRAHSIAEQVLTRQTTLTQLLKTGEIDRATHDGLEMYVDYVHSLDSEVLRIEEAVDFSEWVPGQRPGTADAIGLRNGHIDVVDLKWGQGVRVIADNNPQLRIYGLGALRAWQHLFEFETITLHIVQPRLDHVSTEELSVQSLLHWADTILRPGAALCDQPDAPAIPGEHCRFCKARPTCRALADHNRELALKEFDTIRDPRHLADNEIGDILKQIPLIRSWASAVEEHALEVALHGRAVAGWKLVEGRSNRAWSDADNAEKALRKSKLKVADIFTKKLISPTQALKLLGDDHPVAELVTKPQGKPTLAPANDRRTAITVDPTQGFEEI